MENTVYDVAVIGAGVIGAMTARELMRAQLSVCLLEKENDVSAGASKANSGIIHGGFDPEPGTLKARLNTEGVPLLYRAAEELHVPHRQNGSLVAAFGAEEERTLDELLARGQKNGIPGLRLLTGDEARALEPALSPAVTRALLAPNAGIISPYALTIAAAGNAIDNGAVLLRRFAVCAIRRDGEQAPFTVTSADGRQVRARFLVNCAGAYADRIAAMAGDGFFTIVPRAGEYLLLDHSAGHTVSHTVFQVPTKNGKGVLVTPTADGELLLGPTATPVDAPEDTETTADGLAAVRQLAQKSVPGLDLRAVITAFCGVRASEGHGDFLVQRSGRVPGLIHAAAIDSPGLTSCVAIARRVVALLAESGLTLTPNAAFCGERADMYAFSRLNDEEKDAFIRQHPAYGRIVCRCEQISEGEIRAALRREPRPLDMDGVKRRTRAGMGRCQGGFCTPHVMRLLAEESGIPEDEITKHGGASAMLTGKL